MLEIRRIEYTEAAVLQQLNQEEQEFDLEPQAAPAAPAPADPQALAAALSYLTHPAVYLWGAFAGQELVGFASCLLLPLRYGDPHEILLYEIGVRHTRRRQGVGRALLAAIEQWMQVQGIREIWVLGDNPGAVAFYQACGFTVAADQPVYLTRRLADSAADALESAP